jgi:hypothetical protein
MATDGAGGWPRAAVRLAHPDFGLGTRRPETAGPFLGAPIPLVDLMK